MVSLHDEMERCLVERQTYRLQYAYRWQHLLRQQNIAVILAVDFHSRDDRDQLNHTHFRHSNGNHNGYLQFEAKLMIFRLLNFPKVRCVQ